jgi:uncharacterized membrane protein YfcA
MPLDTHIVLMIAAAGFFAGVQNALAGGGSFITFPALLLAGLNPLAANMTSTIAMFPSQTTAAYAGRKLVSDVGALCFRKLFIISTIAGQQVRTATATKNVLAMAMNAAATLIFATSNLISWPAALALCLGGIAGGICGGYLIHRLPEKLMRGFVVMVGAVLTVWMFSR